MHSDHKGIHLIFFSSFNLQEHETEDASQQGQAGQDGGEDDGDDGDGEDGADAGLQEDVRVERQHRVRLILVFGEAVEDSSDRRRVKETHRTRQDLKETRSRLMTSPSRTHPEQQEELLKHKNFIS